MDLRVAGSLDELSEKFDPQTFNRQYVSRITFRGFQFVNPREESAERLLVELGRKPVFLKISLRRRGMYDNAYLLLVGGVVCAAYYEEGDKRRAGVEAVNLFLDGFSEYESAVVEIYDLDPAFARELEGEMGKPREASEIRVEKQPTAGKAEATPGPEQVSLPSLDEVKERVRGVVEETCKEYGYKVDSLKTLTIGENVVFEVKVSPRSILRRTKIGREELVVKLWNALLPLLARHGIVKARVRVRWGILTYEHP